MKLNSLESATFNRYREMILAHLARLIQVLRFVRPVANAEGVIVESFTKSKHDTIETNDDVCVVSNLISINDEDDDDDDNVKGEDAVDPSIYSSWLDEHPSAISCFNNMLSTANGKQIIVFLDYDGTLSPIINDPDKAFMSEPMRFAVREVARRFPTAIISGRSRHKVSNFVKIEEVYYAGSHGMDIIGPPRELKSYDEKYQSKTTDENGNDFIVFQPAHEFLPAVKEILTELENATCDIIGSLIEDNGYCFSVHYRHVHEKDLNILQERVQKVLKKWPKFHVTKGKKVLEIRPSIKWDKGDALEYLFNTLSDVSISDNDVIPIYIGDDKTDEDAFKVLRGMKRGYPIIVSSNPKETLALYSLKDTKEVLHFLTSLARWNIDSTCSDPVP